MFQVTDDLTYRKAIITAVFLWKQLQLVKDKPFGLEEARMISYCAAYAHKALSLVSTEPQDKQMLVRNKVRNILLDKDSERQAQSKAMLAAMLGVKIESLSAMSLDAMVKKMKTDCSDEKWQKKETLPGDRNPRDEAIQWHSQLKTLFESQSTL